MIQLRHGRAAKYISLAMRDSLKGWHNRWFYVSNPNPTLPACIRRPPALEVCWGSFPYEEEMKDVRILLDHLEAVKAAAQLFGVAVVRSFIKRWIQSINEQDHPAYEYSGRKDPTRESPSLWVPKALDARCNILQC